MPGTINNIYYWYGDHQCGAKLVWRPAMPCIVQRAETVVGAKRFDGNADGFSRFFF